MDLRGIFLHKCNLKDAVLERANLGNSDLSGSDLRGASFRKSKMVKASLRGTALSGARFVGAATNGCDVFGAKIAGVRNLKLKSLKNLSGADSPEIKPLILKDREIARIFGAQNAAVYAQNGTVYLSVGIAATAPLCDFWTAGRTEINVLSQKCFNAEQWEPAKRAEWTAMVWDKWLNIKGMLLTAAETAVSNIG